MTVILPILGGLYLLAIVLGFIAVAANLAGAPVGKTLLAVTSPLWVAAIIFAGIMAFVIPMHVYAYVTKLFG